MSESTTLIALDERIKALELGAQYDANKAEVEKIEKEYQTKLREIESSNRNGGGASSSGLSKEVERLREENEILKKKNAKQEYRILHMLGVMEELWKKQKESS